MRCSHARTSLLAALLLGFALPAEAHLVPVAGVTPFVEDGALVGGGTTWGVVRLDGDGAFRRVCEEALGLPTTFLRMDDGRVLVGRAARGLVATSDGCTHALVEGPLETHVVSALVRVPGAPDRVFAATATTGLANGVFVSEDQGRTFAATSLQVAGRLFFQLGVSDDGQRVVAAGLDTTSQAVVIEVSEDGGATFAPPGADLDAYVYVKLLAIDGAGSVLLAAVDSAGANHLLSSSDALASVSEVATFDGPLLGYAEADGARLVLVRSAQEGKGVYRQPAPGAPFTRIEGGPAACLLRVPGDVRAWGCGEDGQEGHFYVSDDGAAWQALLPFDDVIERCCEPGSSGAEACADYLAQSDAGPSCSTASDDGGPGVGAEPPPSCGCTEATSGPDAAVGIALLALLGLSRSAAARAGRSRPR